MENTKVVEWNDLYLYAKNHYGKSMDRISDLRIILSHNLALNPEDVRVGGMVTILLNTVYKHFNQNSFVDFMTNIDPLESWKVTFQNNTKEFFHVGNWCLSS